MNTSAQIGSSIHIKGDIEAQEPLTIAGQVEGTVRVKGHSLTVAPQGRISATLTADSIVVAGRVNGKVQADSRIVIRDTATVEGQLTAPAIGIAEGATVQGRVETAARSAKVLQMAS